MNDIRAVFDIWNESIRAVVFWKDNNKDVVLAKQTEVMQGMRKGKILDMEAFTSTLNKVLDGFIRKLGGDFIDRVYVWVSHPEMIVNRIVEGKRIMTEEVWDADVEHLSRIVSEIALINNYEIIKIVPVAWIIDEQFREKDPIGLKCKKLELQADVFLIPKNFYNALMDIFDKKLGIEIADLIPNILAASEIVMDYDQKDLWTILIDIGKNQTSYVIYEDGFPLWYGTIGLGWENVTKDISIGMQVDIKEAEEIKKTTWVVVIDPSTKYETSLDMNFLTEIISARYEQIFDRINSHLKSLDKDGRLPWWILLLGGWSKIQHLEYFAKDMFKLAAFYGKDNVVNLWDISNNVQFLNVLGCYYRSQKYEWEWGRVNFPVNFGKIWTKIKDFFGNLF